MCGGFREGIGRVGAFCLSFAARDQSIDGHVPDARPAVCRGLGKSLTHAR
jgi:hypothetical protein